MKQLKRLIALILVMSLLLTNFSINSRAMEPENNTATVTEAVEATEASTEAETATTEDRTEEATEEAETVPEPEEASSEDAASEAAVEVTEAPTEAEATTADEPVMEKQAVSRKLQGPYHYYAVIFSTANRYGGKVSNPYMSHTGNRNFQKVGYYEYYVNENGDKVNKKLIEQHYVFCSQINKGVNDGVSLENVSRIDGWSDGQLALVSALYAVSGYSAWNDSSMSSPNKYIAMQTMIWMIEKKKGMELTVERQRGTGFLYTQKADFNDTIKNSIRDSYASNLIKGDPATIKGYINDWYGKIKKMCSVDYNFSTNKIKMTPSGSGSYSTTISFQNPDEWTFSAPSDVSVSVDSKGNKVTFTSNHKVSDAEVKCVKKSTAGFSKDLDSNIRFFRDKSSSFQSYLPDAQGTQLGGTLYLTAKGAAAYELEITKTASDGRDIGLYFLLRCPYKSGTDPQGKDVYSYRYYLVQNERPAGSLKFTSGNKDAMGNDIGYEGYVTQLDGLRFYTSNPATGGSTVTIGGNVHTLCSDINMMSKNMINNADTERNIVVWEIYNNSADNPNNVFLQALNYDNTYFHSVYAVAGTTVMNSDSNKIEAPLKTIKASGFSADFTNYERHFKVKLNKKNPTSDHTDLLAGAVYGVFDSRNNEVVKTIQAWQQSLKGYESRYAAAIASGDQKTANEILAEYITYIQAENPTRTSLKGMALDTITVDSNGYGETGDISVKRLTNSAATTDPFNYTVYVVELYVPTSALYLLDSTIHPVGIHFIPDNSVKPDGSAYTIEEFTYTEANVESTETYYPLYGNLSLTKYGENVISTTTEKKEGYEITKFNYSDTAVKLDNVSFKITALEDILDPQDPTRILLKEGEEWKTLKTISGELNITDIPYGHYEMEEVKNENDEYYFTSEPIQFYVNAYTLVEHENEYTFQNKHKTATINFEKLFDYKTDAKAEAESYQQTKFGLYVKNALTIGTLTITKDTLVDVITLKDAEKGSFTGKLPLGDYYVKELATSNYFQVNKEKFDAAVTYSSENEEHFTLSLNQKITNEHRPYLTVKFQKEFSDITDAIKNAAYKKTTFGLYSAEAYENKDGNTVAADTLLGECTIDRLGNGSFDFYVPYGGKYYVAETGTDTKHYEINASHFEFSTPLEITDENQIIDLGKIKNKEKGHGTITIKHNGKNYQPEASVKVTSSPDYDQPSIKTPHVKTGDTMHRAFVIISILVLLGIGYIMFTNRKKLAAALAMIKKKGDE